MQFGNTGLANTRFNAERLRRELHRFEAVRRRDLLQYEMGGKRNALQMAHPLEPPEEGFGRQTVRTDCQRVLPRVVEAIFVFASKLPKRRKPVFHRKDT